MSKMTLNPLCSEEMIQLGAIGCLFRIIKKVNVECTKQVLLKVLRNLSRWTKSLQSRLVKDADQTMPSLADIVQDPMQYLLTNREKECTDGEQIGTYTSLYWEKHFWDDHVELMMQCALNCDNEDLLVEWVGILNNITRDDLPGGVEWHDLLDEQHSGIVELFHKMLDKKCHNDLKLELVIWLGELCCSKECSYWVASNNMIDIIHNVFEANQDDEMMLQVIQTLERFLLFEETRYQVLGADGE